MDFCLFFLFTDAMKTNIKYLLNKNIGDGSFHSNASSLNVKKFTVTLNNNNYDYFKIGSFQKVSAQSSFQYQFQSYITKSLIVKGICI